MAFDGDDAEAPEPSEEELALLNEQTKLLRMQRDLVLSQQRQQAAILPVIAQSLGYKLDFNKKGEIVGARQTHAAARMDDMEEQIRRQTLKQLLDPKNQEIQNMQNELLELQLKEQKRELTGPGAQRKRQIERLLQQRTIAALKGDLPVDPALERDINEQGQTLRERLMEQFGPGYETSTPGIEALSKFEESANVLRSQARHGELTLSEQLGAVREGLGVQQAGANFAAAGTGIPGLTSPMGPGGFAFGLGQAGQAGAGTLGSVVGGIPGQAAAGLGSVAGGFSMPLGWMQGNRNMELQASLANSQQTGFMDVIAGIGGGVASTLPFPWV